MARDYQYKQSAKMTSAWPKARAPDTSLEPCTPCTLYPSCTLYKNPVPYACPAGSLVQEAASCSCPRSRRTHPDSGLQKIQNQKDQDQTLPDKDSSVLRSSISSGIYRSHISSWKSTNTII